ncbi:trans-sialidase, putative, partial [Trypanosoma cruzi]
MMERTFLWSSLPMVLIMVGSSQSIRVITDASSLRFLNGMMKLS